MVQETPAADGPARGDPAQDGVPVDAPLFEATGVRWTIFALACGTSALLYIHRYTWSFIKPKLQAEQGFDEQQLGTLGSLFNLAYALCQIPSGALCDAIGPRLFLTTIIVLWSLAVSGQAFAGSFAAVASVRLVFGATQAGGYPALNKVTQVWFAPATRTILQGWIATAFGRGGGALSSVILGTVLIGFFHLSWQTSLLVMSGAGLAFAVAFALLFRNNPAADDRVNDAERAVIAEGRMPTQASVGANVLPWRRALRNRTILVLLVQQFHSAGADAFYSMYLVGFFLSALQTSDATAGKLAGLVILGGAVGGMVGAFLNDSLIRRTGHRRWSRSAVGFAGPILASGTLLLLLAQKNPFAAAVGLFVVKFFVDWSQPTVWGTITDVGGRYSATAFSIVNTSGTLGSVVTPIVFGLILQRSTDAATKIPDYGPLLALLAGMYVVSGCCWLLIDCTRRLEQETAG